MTTPLELGVMAGVGDDLEQKLALIQQLGIPTCQLSCAAETAARQLDPARVIAASREYNVRISALFFVFEGQRYNNVEGPPTMGLVPVALRAQRLPLAKRFADIACAIGVRDVVTHIGFIPDDERDPVYQSFIDTMRDYCLHLKAQDQHLLFETGQELPSTLLRTIRDIGTGNAFVNLDTANLILYGKANPLDAVEILGDYVRGMHAKDGLHPNRGEALGIEVPLGEGEVNFPLVLRRLKQRGFAGPVTIEREVAGPEQVEGIRRAMAVLQPLL